MRQVLLLALFGVALILSNRYFTFIDDEVLITSAATRPVRTTLELFWSGAGQHEHPPLYDIVLHFWLKLTGGAFEWLRIPSIVFFVAGLLFLSRSAHRLGGFRSASAVIWLGILCPYGFHYARLATWYSLSFLLITALTLAYLRFLEAPNPNRRWVLTVLSVALLWTNYLGLAIVACLGIDQWFRRCRGEPAISGSQLARIGALLVVSFVPLMPAFMHELPSGINLRHPALTVLANAAFSVYSLFVSESMAPWFWPWSIPAGLAVLICSVLAYMHAPLPARRLANLSALLVSTMALTGILGTKRLLLVAPWGLLLVGVAIGTMETRWARYSLATALMVIASIGWFGIVSRRYYAAPRFIEPWSYVADQAAQEIQSNAIVIGNNPSFFFYLTYDLRVPKSELPWRFVSVLPEQVRHPQVDSAEDWFAAGHALVQKMLWVRGMAGPQGDGLMTDAARLLDKQCRVGVTRRMLHDDGYRWKERFFPELGEVPWRVEIREYDCGIALAR